MSDLNRLSILQTANCSPVLCNDETVTLGDQKGGGVARELGYS